MKIKLDINPDDAQAVEFVNNWLANVSMPPLLEKEPGKFEADYTDEVFLDTFPLEDFKTYLPRAPWASPEHMQLLIEA